MPKVGLRHLKNKFDEQLEFLESACRLYDQGRHRESIRMATAIRVLFHHKGGSKSLIHHLKRADINLFSSGGLYRPGPIFFDRYGLASSYYQAPAAGMGSPVPFQYWWNDLILVSNGWELSRSLLVLTMANKDGGAHVDGELPKGYDKIINRGIYTARQTANGPVSIAVVAGEGTIEGTPFSGSHLLAIRCIAGEILRSPELFELAKS